MSFKIEREKGKEVDEKRLSYMKCYDPSSSKEKTDKT